MRSRAAVVVVALGLLAFALVAPAHADDTFTPGSGAASATTFVFNIPYSGANIGFGVGDASTRYFEQTATASAQSVSPGFLGLAKISHVCGTASAVPIPDPTTADTKRTGAAETNQKSAPQGGFGASSEFAEATPGSSAKAVSEGLTAGLPGIVRIDGGVASSESRMDAASQTRTVIADVGIGTLTLAGGIVVLKDMHWHVEQSFIGPDDRSRTATKAAAFSLGGATIKPLGLPLSFPEGTPVQTVVDAANGVLGAVGLQIVLPEELPNGDQGTYLSPLTIRIGGKTGYGPVLYPLLAGTSDLSVINVFNKLGAVLFDPADCNQLAGLMKASPELNALYNTVGLLAPLVINAFAAAINGGASVDLSVGGVRTILDDTYYAPRPVPSIPSRPPLPLIQDDATAGTPGRAPSAGSEATPGAAVASGMQTASSASSTCATTSPVGRPGCWKGAAPIAAGLAGALTLGLLVGDEIVRRRRLAAMAVDGGRI
jgi:hypothetical protein